MIPTSKRKLFVRVMKIQTVVVIMFGATAISVHSGENKYLRTAREAAQWLESTAISTDKGVVWPTNPTDPKSINTSLYYGTPGPILFFLEAYRYTKNERYLTDARKGSDELLDSMEKEQSTGLYEGLAGIGFALGETYLFTNEKKYRDAVLQVVDRLSKGAKHVGKGVEWGNGEDIIAGDAGTGLFLLWADKELSAPAARDLAVETGQRLIELGHTNGPGKTSWVMDESYPEMPNFSHGTAGVAYFLTALYLETKQKQFLDAGLAGANYLISIADTQNRICLIYHDAKHKDLYYLSWCHGPAGVARLFYQLYRATGNPQWIDWMERSAKAMTDNGAPNVVVTPGDWNNISACCGVAAQAEFFLDLYRITNNKEYLDIARQGSDRLLAAATIDDTGARWLQAENRSQPNFQQTQTGYMQGASGVGMWLLHMGAFSEDYKERPLTFPDNPFPY
jgi:lantibiotic modifying enzyme